MLYGHRQDDSSVDDAYGDYEYVQFVDDDDDYDDDHDHLDDDDDMMININHSQVPQPIRSMQLRVSRCDPQEVTALYKRTCAFTS